VAGVTATIIISFLVGFGSGAIYAYWYWRMKK
jgi:hypothetical protein